MAKIGGRLIGFLTLFVIIYNINIVFATEYEKYRIDVDNENDRIQSTTVSTLTRESSSLFDTLTTSGGVVASQSTLTTPTAANSTDNTVQEEKETEDDMPENERKNNSAVNQIEDHHQYYNSTIFVDKERVEAYWNEIRNTSPNWMLSQSYRRAMTVVLSFDFPFYGRPVRNVTVATGGFMSTADYVHSWLLATQYIAPLMANFDTSLSDDSLVRLNDTGSSFTVLWENVYLQHKQDVGKFTFSTTLHKNGDIVFTYYSVPISPEAIQDGNHSVNVGLSDAYMFEKVIYFARKKTIYEYHRINLANADITNSTIITLKALPTCLEYIDCASCVNHATAFNCSWCPTVNRCSSGLDRQRQNWFDHGCDQHHVAEEDSCPASVSETLTKEEAVMASEATLITSVEANSSDESVEKEKESSAIDNSSDSKEQKEEVTANSTDDTVKRKRTSLKKKS